MNFHENQRVCVPCQKNCKCHLFKDQYCQSTSVNYSAFAKPLCSLSKLMIIISPTANIHGYLLYSVSKLQIDSLKPKLQQT